MGGACVAAAILGTCPQRPPRTSADGPGSGPWSSRECWSSLRGAPGARRLRAERARHPRSSLLAIRDSSGPAADQDDGVIRLLFLGNSHTARHDVPGTVAALWRAADPAVDVVAVRSSASMLTNERQSHRPSRALVASRAWDVVVIQGQNYSTSGRFEYPTTGAETFARLASERGAQPVLYAEWPRRDVDESARIVATYARVAEREPSCLPPVPESFDLALRRYPGWSCTPRTATTPRQRERSSPRWSCGRRCPVAIPQSCRPSWWRACLRRFRPGSARSPRRPWPPWRPRGGVTRSVEAETPGHRRVRQSLSPASARTRRASATTSSTMTAAGETELTSATPCPAHIEVASMFPDSSGCEVWDS